MNEQISTVGELGKNAEKVLLFLRERGAMNKSNLRELISNVQTYDRILTELENMELLRTTETTSGPKVITVELTQKGKEVAEMLYKIQLMLVTGIPMALEKDSSSHRPHNRGVAKFPFQDFQK